jgi:preprotein translocase subunit YajC
MQPTADLHSPLSFVPAALMIAQDNQVAPATGGAAVQGSTASPPTASTATPGTGGGTAAPRPGGLFDPQFLLLIMALVLGLIVMSSMGQRRDRKKREAMISAIKKHDRVQTIGGVIGSVVEVKPDYIVLKVDESSNTRITFSRSAIAQVLTAAPEPAASAKTEPTAT